MRILLLASTAFLALSPTIVLADDNDAYILQVGTDNKSVQEQSNLGNTAAGLQAGSQNKIRQTQEGVGDTAVAVQAGRSNLATQKQLAGSAGNLAASVQVGTYNTVEQTQGAEGKSVDTFNPAGRGTDPVRTTTKFDIPSVASAAVPSRPVMATGPRNRRSARITSPVRSRPARTTLSSRPRAPSAK
jgi:hypothetical protein